MKSFRYLTLDQVDAIDRGLNKCMALARVMANGAVGEGVGYQPPEPVDLFLVMQVLLEELEKIWEITREAGKSGAG